jgi:TolB-like protein/Tfp pilus assembly protein PilF
MSDVFISYKAEDRSRVEPLVDAVEAEGLDVWWDARVSGGDAWRETIARQLEAAGCVIVVWSKRSTGPEGRFVRDEASWAQKRGTYLPITIDKVDPPLGFGETQALPLRAWKGDAADPRYKAISDCVHQILGKERSQRNVTPPRPARGARVDRRTALIGGGAATLAVAGIGGFLLLRPSGAKANTVAVLPFANLSGDRSQDYFSDGLAEEVRSALAATGGLDVVARTSSERLRDTDAISVAKQLSVANVITGSVRRSPSTVRVSAQLIDGKSGLERWSQTFDRPFGDVLQIQTDIAANVARALSLRLISIAQAKQTLGGTNNPQALDVLLQATANSGDDSNDGMLRGIALYQRAAEIDPNYAEAHARKGLSQTLWANAYAPSVDDKYRADAEAMQSIRRALAIAPSMSLAHTALGLVYYNELRMKLSAQELRRAVELPAADTVALANYAVVLCRTRRQAEAQQTVERAINLDPLNPIPWMIKTWTLFLGRRYPEAIEAGNHTLTIAPENRRAATLIAWSLLMLGRTDEAVKALQHVPADDYRRLVAEGAIAARAGRKEDAAKALQALSKGYGDTVTFQQAEIYAQLGETDRAIQALEAGLNNRDAGVGAILVDPFLDPVRNDPRFSAIASRVFS